MGEEYLSDGYKMMKIMDKKFVPKSKAFFFDGKTREEKALFERKKPEQLSSK